MCGITRGWGLRISVGTNGVRYLLPISAAAASWFGMQAVHEMGHVLAGVLTGGTVANVALHPLELSRTDLDSNPQPLLVVWAGPVVGVALPVVLWGAFAILKSRYAFLLRFFAGFCLVANGAYIGIGSFDGIGDCGEMLRCGSPMWVLWAFGACGIAAGFLAWHRLGTAFGLGATAAVPPPARSAGVCLGALMVLLALGIAVGS